MVDRTVNFQLLSLLRGKKVGEFLLDEQEEIGGKAKGLLSIHKVIAGASTREVTVSIPKMYVIGTSVFDAFMQRNALWNVALSDLPDDRIAHAFQNGDLPFEVLGELRTLTIQWTMPLAVRSSGWLEDSTQRPFAGVYRTKMIPNNSYDPDVRFQKMVEAIKLVWASTFFKLAKDYCQATDLSIENEKMAVIVQEIVGKRYHDRFYPELSGVARTYSYYPVQPARPEDGVVNLALGLGKTIVDGGKSWIYSPAFPEKPPPFDSPQDLLDETQNEFWLVNMGEPPEYDPIKETEYMRKENLMIAERDGALRYLVSTYDMETGRLSIGSGVRGPRALTFSPLLSLHDIPFNRLVTDLLDRCEQALGSPVEIEFAMTFDPHRLGFLQVRPMVVPDSKLEVSPDDLMQENAIIASDMVMGNGTLDGIQDIVYVIPEHFNLKNTREIADELEQLNQKLLVEKRSYILIVFGRLGTLDPWLGIPVTWGQVCGAKVIVEATQENVRVELSQGAHYFHNIINLGVKYFCVPFSSQYHIKWDWLERQLVIQEGHFTRHVQLPTSLRIKVDGRSGRGVVFRF